MDICLESKSISFDNNQNIRELVVEVLHPVMNRAIVEFEDNTNLLVLITMV